MLTHLEVDGFKNLVNFAVDFGPFTCIARPNSVGKSNVFDAIRFLSLRKESMIRRLGPFKATLLITFFAIFVSVSITVTAILIVYDASVLPFGIILSALLPGTIAPAIAYTFFRLLAQLEQAQREKEMAIVELQAALANVKRLSGLLPICASCKKIRDDEGYWHQVEVYIRSRTEADFSHGICPDCLQKLYPSAHRRAQDDSRNRTLH